MSSSTLELHLRSVLHAVPPADMVFSPAFRMYVRAPAPEHAGPRPAASTEAFSALQQHVQTYLEHEQQLMSSRIAFAVSLSLSPHPSLLVACACSH